MVEDGGLLPCADLKTLHGHLIKGRFGLICVEVTNHFDVSLKELLFDHFSIDHRTALIVDVWVFSVWRGFARIGIPNLEVWCLEVTFDTVLRHLVLGLGTVACSFSLANTLDDFVETWHGDGKLMV